jgi:hypothetical protein
VCSSDLSEVGSAPLAAEPTSDPVGDPGQAAGDPAPAGAPIEDVWKDAPPALRAQFDELKRQQATLAGRVSAADRRANFLQQQLETAKQQGVEPAKAREPSERLKRLKEEYPEIADPILEELADIRSRQDALAAPVEQIEQQQLQQDLQVRLNALAEKHPDWQTYSTDARWGDFLAAQPQFVRDMHARNVDVSDPDEAADVLTRFKGFIGAVADPAPTPAPQNQAAALKRQRQLDAARDGGSNGGGATTSGVPDDFDAAARIYAEKKERQLQQSRMR